MANSRSRRPKEYFVIVDGLPARSGSLKDMRSLAITLHKINKKNKQERDITLNVRDWSAPGGSRLVKDYSVAKPKHKPSKFMRDLRKELKLD